MKTKQVRFSVVLGIYVLWLVFLGVLGAISGTPAEQPNAQASPEGRWLEDR